MAARAAVKTFEDLKTYLSRLPTRYRDYLTARHIAIQKETEVLYDFENTEAIKEFECVTDEEVGGKSTANLTTSRHDRLLFHGHVSHDVKRSVEIDFTGFCAIQSLPKYGLFNKLETVDTDYFDCVEIKYRGDGRKYFVNIQTETREIYPDGNKGDLCQGHLFTKGGPYWEIERIPFTKFYMTTEGFLWDNQLEIDNIRTIGVSLVDKNTGPFRLEIDSLKLVRVGWQPPTFKTKECLRYNHRILLPHRDSKLLKKY